MEALDMCRNFLDEIFQQHKTFCETGVLVFFSVCCIFVYYWKNGLFRKKSLPPGPMGIPLLGYLPFLGKDPYITLNNLSKKYGNVFSLKLGPSYVVVCNDWESKKDAFNKTEMLNRPEGLFDAVPHGFGIVGNNGNDWIEQRRFCVRVMRELGFGKSIWEEMVLSEVREAFSIIQETKNQAVNVGALLNQFFTGSLMGLVLGCHLTPTHPTVKYVSERMNVIMENISFFDIRNFWPSLFNTLAKLGLYGSSIVLPKAAEFSKVVEDLVQEQVKDDGSENPLSFTKMYFQEVENNRKLKLGNSFTVSTLCANAQALLVGGVDTTKDTTAWLLAAMAGHQEIQSKVRQELDTVVGREAEITWAMRTKIPYTHACVYEALRWRTLLPISPLRRASEDTTILGYHVPKGTILIGNNWAIHNDPRYWSDPEKFDPERFLEDGGTKVNTTAESFSPFSQGRRNCPGKEMAILDVLLFFASMVQKFQILPEDDRGVLCEPLLGLTYKPSKLKLRFIPRE